MVDDDSLTRMLMGRMLARMGCQTAAAENGLLALEQIMATPPPKLRVVGDTPLTLEEAWAEEDARFSIIFLVSDFNIFPKYSGSYRGFPRIIKWYVPYLKKKNFYKFY